jgi:hypothetical protein
MVGCRAEGLTQYTGINRSRKDQRRKRDDDVIIKPDGNTKC